MFGILAQVLLDRHRQRRQIAQREKKVAEKEKEKEKEKELKELKEEKKEKEKQADPPLPWWHPKAVVPAGSGGVTGRRRAIPYRQTMPAPNRRTLSWGDRSPLSSSPNSRPRRTAPRQRWCGP